VNLPLPPDSASVAGRLIDSRLHLLDRQVLDRDGLPVTTVDDIALSKIPAGPLPKDSPSPTITALLSGAFRFTRIFGGRPPMSRLDRISWSDLAEIGTAIRLRAARDTLQVGWFERWAARNVIGKIPGGRHDPE
jgi:hypothetical protein